jgi:tetratricopeptide (TPR) repeat protein
MSNEKERNTGPGWDEYYEAVEMQERGESAPAAAGFHNALRDFEEAEDRHGIANACFRLADICTEKEEFGRAIEFLERAEEICRAENDDVSLLSTSTRKAAAFRGKGEPEKAIPIYLELIDTYHTFNNPDATVRTLKLLSGAYAENGEREKAADALRTAASIHRNFGHKRHAAALEEEAGQILAGG